MLEVYLAQPRGFCAGVGRAIEIVETALEVYGSPVYVLHEIVHNQHVVADLSTRGARFVERLEEIPKGAVVIFSAHGVAGEVEHNAMTSDFEVIDATCPLVTKVHLEVMRHAEAGREVIVIGHAGHPEIIGTLGRYDTHKGGGIYLVETAADVAELDVKDPDNIGFVTQTTLSIDDTKNIIDALKARFPSIQRPRQDDICYATQNRQNAVRDLAKQVDLLLVVGARNSSNSNRLREVGEHTGVTAYLIPSADDIEPAWFNPPMRVGITAGASAPETLVQEVLEKLRGFDEVEIKPTDGKQENVVFRLPNNLLNKKQELATA